MTPFVSDVTKILSLLTIATQIFLVAVIGAAIFRRFSISRMLLSLISENVLRIGFLLSLGSFLASLFYSEYAGFDPCTLCWIQRILMYPQMFLFGLAMAKKDRGIIDYALSLSVPGLIISLYHVFIQNGYSGILPCGADSAASCSKRYFIEYGYITIPVMSATILAFSVVSLLIGKYFKNIPQENQIK